MAKINQNYDKLAAGYLFPRLPEEQTPFSIRIREPRFSDWVSEIRPNYRGGCIEGLHDGVGFAGRRNLHWLWPFRRSSSSREALAREYGELGVDLSADEFFVSDGAKSDSANIQSIFSQNCVVAVQDPAYPVYVDSNVIYGRTGGATDSGYEGLTYMPCTEENDFFPPLPDGKVDLIYLCSPNNPTGAVATKSQLKSFVDYALEHKAIIFFDSAYSAFITDPELPRSIYEVEGADKCAIEFNSFSKTAGLPECD